MDAFFSFIWKLIKIACKVAFFLSFIIVFASAINSDDGKTASIVCVAVALYLMVRFNKYTLECSMQNIKREIRYEMIREVNKIKAEFNKKLLDEINNQKKVAGKRNHFLHGHIDGRIDRSTKEHLDKYHQCDTCGRYKEGTCGKYCPYLEKIYPQRSGEL